MIEPGRSNVIGVEHTTSMTHGPCEANLHACLHIFNRNSMNGMNRGLAPFDTKK